MRAFHLSLVGLCLILFTASATNDLALPGPHVDEMAHACLALDMTRPPHPFSRDYTLHIGAQPFPFGVDPHTGALKAYLLWPLFALFGPSVELVRLFTIFLGLTTLLFFYLFCRDIFSRWPAFWGLLLLSLDSSFIFYSKLDAGPIVEQLLWMMTGLWSFFKWRNSPRLFYLFLGLSSGLLGIYSHVAFIWFILAFSFALWGIRKEEFKRLFGKETLPWVIFFSILSLTIFIYWLIQQSLHFPYGQLAGIRDVVLMFERLSTCAGIVPEVLRGYWSEQSCPVQMDTRPLTDFFFVSVLLFLWRYHWTKRVQFFFLFLGAGVVQMALTPENLGIYPHRMMLFYIFFPFLSGVAVQRAWMILQSPNSFFGIKRIISTVLLLLFFFSVIGQCTLTQEAIRAIRETGGRGFWSDATYALAEYLKKERWKRIICLNSGFKGRLSIPLRMEVLIEEVYQIEQLKEEMEGAKTPETLFLIYNDKVSTTMFEQAAREIGGRPLLDRIFKQRGRWPVYLVYRLEPIP